jgi:hypothetical protein
MLPPGGCFEFILEGEKRDKIKKVISHNHGEVLSETFFENDVRMRVRKILPTNAD